MSVKEELLLLKQKRTTLLTKLANVESTLEELSTKRASLSEKIESLEVRISTLAKELAEESRSELNKLDQNIAQVLEERSILEQSLQENERKISEREGHTTLYIQEQVERMVPMLLEYIKQHSKEIGHSIKRTFHIKETENRDTSIIAIFDGEEQITSTTDFYFEGDRYLRTGAGLCVKFEKTLWYSKYCEDLQKAFNKKLKESWPYNDTFELTINGTTFTLELV